MMHHRDKTCIQGLRVARVYRGSDAFCAGIRAGDRILYVNGESVADELDFSFLSAVEHLRLTVHRNGAAKNIKVCRTPGSLLGIDLVQTPVARCTNRCIFCFIDQLPPGLRKRLYIKDEDYRHSFLNGSYITLTSMKDSQLERIALRGISPLYISVHATDPDVRRRMLRNLFAGKILQQLAFLIECDITVHTQIVVCPGLNDEEVLENTITDLLSFNERMQSVAVVPVGLTRFRNKELRPVGKREALDILSVVEPLSHKDKEKVGFRRLFAADELFVKAGKGIPASAYYEDYPQIENGVGLLRSLMEEWEQLRSGVKVSSERKPGSISGSFLILTSCSAVSFIDGMVQKIGELLPRSTFSVCSVTNDFFGDSVTVAGLLTAKDMIKAARKHGADADSIFIPSCSLNYRGYTLDGYSLNRMRNILGKPVYAPASLQDLLAICMGKD